MKVVQIPRRFVRSDWGGTETVILETSKRLLKMGYNTEIMCPNALADQNQEIVGGVRVMRKPYFYPYLGLGAAKRQLDYKGGNLFSFSLLKELQKYPYLNLIHLHTGKRLGGIGRYVAKQRNIPYIVSLHGGVFDVPSIESESLTAPTQGTIEWGKALGWWVGSRNVLDDASAVVCVGQEEQLQVQERYPQKRVIHLPNGVDVDRFANGNRTAFRKQYGIPAQARMVLTVGRIDPQKNQLFAVDLLPQLREIDPDTHLVLIGHVTNEAYFTRLVREIEARGLKNHVTVIRGLNADSQDLVDAYHAADIFLLPSIHEPFGIVILEAWAAGLPVLASRVGGVPSFVNHGENGLLCKTNDKKEFCRAFRMIVDCKEMGRALACMGQRKAQSNYAWEHITSQLANLYEDVRREHSVCQ